MKLAYKRADCKWQPSLHHGVHLQVVPNAVDAMLPCYPALQVSLTLYICAQLSTYMPGGGRLARQLQYCVALYCTSLLFVKTLAS